MKISTNTKKHTIAALIAMSVITLVGLFSFLIAPKASAATYYIESFEQLKAALAEENNDKILILTQDIEVSETVVLTGNIAVSSSVDAKIARAESCLSHLFKVESGANVSFAQNGEQVLTIDGQSIVANGSAFNIAASAKVTFGKGIEIVNFDSETVSGSVVFSNGELIVDGAKIHDNKLSATVDKEKYGVIHNYQGSTFRFKSGEFYNNETLSTGILFMNNNTVFEMTGGKIYKNSTTEIGTIYIKNSDVTFTGGEIYENSAVKGGGIYVNGVAEVSMAGVKIYKNTADEYGAGMYIGNGDAKITIDGAEIFENVSAKSGAGVFINEGQVVMLSGKVSDNSNESGNGAGFINKDRLTIKGGEIKNNTAVSKGGAIYSYDTSELTIEGGTISGNSAGSNGGAVNAVDTILKVSGGTFSANATNEFGGAIYTENTVATIEDGTFTNNSAKYGGAVCVYTSSTATVSGGSFCSNISTGDDKNDPRGKDFYVGGSKTEVPTLTLVGGEMDEVGAQYGLVQLGGSVKIKEEVETHATKSAGFARVEIVSEIENPVKFKGHSSVKAETASTAVKFLQYKATDPYSNIYRSARKISFDNNLYAVVENGIMLVSSGEHKIDLEEECVVSAPLAAAEGEAVSFAALSEYQISNVVVTGEDGTAVDVTNTDGVWSFVMPAQNVSIDYDYTKKELDLVVDSNIVDMLQVDSTYQFKEVVDVVVIDSDVKKVVSLGYEYNGKVFEIEIVDNKVSFVMFEGAKLVGETKNYYDITFAENDLIDSVELTTEKTNKGLEGETVVFAVKTNQTGDNARYAIKKVYYTLSNNEQVEISKNTSGKYSFEMPNEAVEIEYEFVDVLDTIAGEKAFVYTEADLVEALTGESKVVILGQDIVLTQTIKVAEGEFTLMSISGAIISRAQTLKGNMFEVGYKTTLNLSTELDVAGNIVIDGQKDTVSGVEGAAIFVYNSGFVNIYNKAIVRNNKIEVVNFNYTQNGRGNASAGGAAIYNFNGIVNMYGGEICDNYSSTNGSAVYNHGRFNLYGGSIHNNSTDGRGNIYNVRIFNQEGGAIENNKSSNYGAAVYIANSSYAFYYLIDGEVKNNEAGISGGAFYVGEQSVIWIKGGKISGNYAKTNGGAINNKGTLFVVDGTIENNEAGSKGGAIHTYGPYTKITGGTFEGNVAKSGGAVSVQVATDVFVYGGTFVSNKATERGGAIYAYGEKNTTDPAIVTLTGGSFAGNEAEEGAQICVQYAVVKIGGDLQIDGTIEFVANKQKYYAYVEVISVPTNTITIRPNEYAYEIANLEYSVLRVADGVDANAVAEKVVPSSTKYYTKVDGNQIFILKYETEA